MHHFTCFSDNSYSKERHGGVQNNIGPRALEQALCSQLSSSRSEVTGRTPASWGCCARRNWRNCGRRLNRPQRVGDRAAACSRRVPGPPGSAAASDGAVLPAVFCWSPRARVVAAAACCDSSVRTPGSSVSAASASSEPPLPSGTRAAACLVHAPIKT